MLIFTPLLSVNNKQNERGNQTKDNRREQDFLSLQHQLEQLPSTTTNNHISLLQVTIDCSSKPVELHPTSLLLSDKQFADISDCVNLCQNEHVTLLNAGSKSNIFYDNFKLKPNTNYCLLKDENENGHISCNQNTTTTMLTVNSHTCKSRFPNLFGGPTGDQIVACSDKLINDPANILWDNSVDSQVVDPASLANLFDEDEKLPATPLQDTDYTNHNDKVRYRFTCKWFGTDELGNNYISHPVNRFKPMRNWCASRIASVPAGSVSTKWTYDKAGNLVDYLCDCGDPAITRLQNSVPGEFHSQCIPVSTAIQLATSATKNRKLINYSYPCFTVNSPITALTQYLPCNSDIFNRPPNSAAIQTQSIQIPFSEYITNSYIEHPLYSKFTASESKTFTNKVKNKVKLFE